MIESSSCQSQNVVDTALHRTMINRLKAMRINEQREKKPITITTTTLYECIMPNRSDANFRDVKYETKYKTQNLT